MIRLIFLIFILSITHVFGQESKLTVEKLWSLNRLSGTAVSRNEKWVFFQSTSYDYKINTGKTVCQLMNLASKKTQELRITGAWNFFWDEQNNLEYLIKQNDNTLLMAYSPELGKTTTLNDFGATDISGLVLSSDGKKCATLEPVKLRQTITDKYPDLNLTNARVEESLMYRHWNAWTPTNSLHLFWYQKTNEGKYEKRADVMQGEPYPSVTGPFAGIESVCFSRDGQVIFYSTKKKSGKDFAVSTNSEIYAFRTQDNITTTLSSAHKGYDTQPSINASGKTLAWLSMENDGFESDKNRLRIMNLETRMEQDLTASIDLSVAQYEWHPQKEIIYFTAVVHGTKQLFQVDIKTQKIVQLTKEQCDFASVFPLKDKIILEKQSMIVPTDLWLFTQKTGEMEQLTKVNETNLANFDEPTVKPKWVTTTDGKKMLVWMIYPPNFDPNKKYPTLLYCQGGPQSPVSQFFSYRWNFRLMASEGYIVIAPNRRGLPGFGQEWNDAISKDWGGQPMLDYLTAVDSCVALEPAIDKDKLGAVGASYGGYSVYYLAGIHNKRFKTFVSHCGLFNLESWYGTTEELFFANWDIGGPYWLPENKAAYAKNSPHNLVINWNTPMLVIHGGKDYRVPESEGLQAFQALQIKGIPSKLLYFPDEGHWITKPQNAVLWYREYFEWLNTYLK